MELFLLRLSDEASVASVPGLGQYDTARTATKNWSGSGNKGKGSAQKALTLS